MSLSLKAVPQPAVDTERNSPTPNEAVPCADFCTTLCCFVQTIRHQTVDVVFRQSYSLSTQSNNEALLLTSKEIIERTGISRATLNNYIASGLVPRPQVLPPGPEDGAAPRIGYFPDDTISRIETIHRLKR